MTLSTTKTFHAVMSLFTIFFLYILALAHAAPLVKRIVVSPPITSPTASTVWNVGDKVLVTWSVVCFLDTDITLKPEEQGHI